MFEYFIKVQFKKKYYLYSAFFIIFEQKFLKLKFYDVICSFISNFRLKLTDLDQSKIMIQILEFNFSDEIHVN